MLQSQVPQLVVSYQTVQKLKINCQFSTSFGNNFLLHEKRKFNVKQTRSDKIFLKKIEDISPFCGTTDTPVL